MKESVKCPNCQSKNVSHANKKNQVVLGVIMAVIGCFFLFFALTYAVGYYMFALPLVTVGSIHAYEGYCYAQSHVCCKDCDTEFEYYSVQPDERRQSSPAH